MSAVTERGGKNFFQLAGGPSSGRGTQGAVAQKKVITMENASRQWRAQPPVGKNVSPVASTRGRGRLAGEWGSDSGIVSGCSRSTGPRGKFGGRRE